MARKSIRPQSRRHIWAYDEDWDFISEIVAHRSQMQPGTWIREMIHRIIVQLREERYYNKQNASKLLEKIESENPND